MKLISKKEQFVLTFTKKYFSIVNEKILKGENFMVKKLLIDADSCPVVDLALKIAKEFELQPILFCDTSHQIERENVLTIIVSKGRDAADFRLVKEVGKGDIIITNDYGLAAMCLAKGGYVINANGKYLTSDNIDSLLYIRHEHVKIRKAGGRTKGPKKRTEENNNVFEINFRKLCERVQ